MEMHEGQRVLVKLHGDDEWYPGTVLDRQRKMWVALDRAPDYMSSWLAAGDEFIADEANIAEWKPAE